MILYFEMQLLDFLFGGASCEQAALHFISFLTILSKYVQSFNKVKRLLKPFLFFLSVTCTCSFIPFPFHLFRRSSSSPLRSPMDSIWLSYLLKKTCSFMKGNAPKADTDMYTYIQCISGFNNLLSLDI